jgi:hypothetical protein
MQRSCSSYLEALIGRPDGNVKEPMDHPNDSMVMEIDCIQGGDNDGTPPPFISGTVNKPRNHNLNNNHISPRNANHSNNMGISSETNEISTVTNNTLQQLLRRLEEQQKQIEAQNKIIRELQEALHQTKTLTVSPSTTPMEEIANTTGIPSTGSLAHSTLTSTVDQMLRVLMTRLDHIETKNVTRHSEYQYIAKMWMKPQRKIRSPLKNRLRRAEALTSNLNPIQLFEEKDQIEKGEVISPQSQITEHTMPMHITIGAHNGLDLGR